MTDPERQAVLEDLCRQINGRSDSHLALGYERGMIQPGDLDYERARDIHQRVVAGMTSASRNFNMSSSGV